MTKVELYLVALVLVEVASFVCFAPLVLLGGTRGHEFWDVMKKLAYLWAAVLFFAAWFT